MKSYSLIFLGLCMQYAASAHASEAEISLKHNLDGFLSGYCLDIKGGGKSVDPANGLQSHTCYSYRGALGTDQIFETSRFNDNQLYMPKFDVCAQLSAIEVGATVTLAQCDQNNLQNINFLPDGTIRPVEADNLCLSAGLATTRGRGGTSDHQIKTLTLQECSSERAIFQQWTARAGS